MLQLLLDKLKAPYFKQNMKIIYQLLACIAIALLLFAYQNEYIIIAKPQSYNPLKKRMQIAKVTLEADSSFGCEEKEVALCGDLQTDLQALLNCYLSWLTQERSRKKVCVETTMLTPSEQTLFISFDRKPFGKQDSIAQKILFIQSLCSIIRQHTSSIRSIYFLLHHKPLHDPHLDFNRSWDINC